MGYWWRDGCIWIWILFLQISISRVIVSQIFHCQLQLIHDRDQTSLMENDNVNETHKCWDTIIYVDYNNKEEIDGNLKIGKINRVRY